MTVEEFRTRLRGYAESLEGERQTEVAQFERARLAVQRLATEYDGACRVAAAPDAVLFQVALIAGAELEEVPF